MEDIVRQESALEKNQKGRREPVLRLGFETISAESPKTQSALGLGQILVALGMERRNPRLVPRKGYLGRDGIKCLWARGVVGLLRHAGAGSRGGKPKPYRCPCED